MWDEAETKHIFFMLGGWGFTGPSGGPAGTSKEKTVKKSLGSESAVPPGPIMGGKEEQGNLDLDHPGRDQRLEGQGGNEDLVCISSPWVISEQFYNSSCFCAAVGRL